MNVLLVFAHPEPRSFSGALRDAARAVLESEGHTVVESDLYAMDFNPVPGWHDFVDHDRQEYFGYAEQQKRAHAEDSFAPDLRAEMEKLAACDVVLLVFPLWWYGMPAILKGWVDRVFAAGFAYGGGRWFDRGVFCGKRGMVAVTVGGPETAYAPDGLQGDIRQILFPIHRGVLQYTGFSVVEPFVAFGASYANPDERQNILSAFRERMRSLSESPADPAPCLNDFDQNFRRRGVAADGGS